MAEMTSEQTFKAMVSKKDAATLLSLARFTETAERYEDMCVIMGKIVKEKKELGVEERNMLSVAYKNVVGNRRASWRALNSEDGANKTELTTDYRTVVEAELQSKCQEVLDLLSENLLKTDDEQKKYKADAKDAKVDPDDRKAKEDLLETQVFYLKMSGDYYRYLAEFKTDNEDHKKQAEAKYQKALDLAEVLAPTHPTRLGLALNASVCYWEIMKKPKEACDLAKSAFDKAIQKLDSLSDSTYKDSTLIMQLLRDNLTIWTDQPDGQKQPPAENDNELDA